MFDLKLECGFVAKFNKRYNAWKNGDSKSIHMSKSESKCNCENDLSNASNKSCDNISDNEISSPKVPEVQTHISQHVSLPLPSSTENIILDNIPVIRICHLPTFTSQVIAIFL